jgi:hypothetical protein
MDIGVGLWILGIRLGLILAAFVLAFFVHVFLTALRFFEEENFFCRVGISNDAIRQETQ